LVLRDAGNDVRSVAEEGPGLSDEEVAALCDRDERVLLTFDKDFGELVFRRGLSAGSAIVLFRLVPESPAEVSAILRSLMETGTLVAGVFCVVTRERVRTRPLHQRATS
jgi:predicted nuclease of predicted toxin-antitoxin system